MSTGSTDVGDVTLVVPTAYIRYPAFVPGFVVHNWTVTASTATSIAHKAISAAAKISAFTAYDLLTRPKAMEKIRNEFKEMSRKRPYKTFLPDEATPPLGMNASLMEKFRPALEKFYIHP